ncbi:WxL domain-containing protein [Streptomyces sp. NBC_01384]|uniref:hypothetical protein n=1 Tax=Streptomyces sp. NBC_01384 TaxID=2903847 RepID=UPI00324A9DF3
MRKRIVISPLIAGAAVAALASPLPASAADTPVTVQVTAGTLDISVPAGPVNLGTVAVSGSAQTVSSPLGNVTVTDDRGAITGWHVTAGATDFTGPQNISVSAAGSSSYDTPSVSTSGTVNVASTNLTQLYPPSTVETATGVSGINSATWNPTISLTIPANALAGTYSSTVTHSVL